MTQFTPPLRCRLVLIAPSAVSTDWIEALPDILAAGDVASFILPQFDLDDQAFQKLAEKVTPVVQAAGAAMVIAGETRVAARVGADGVHVEGNRVALEDAIERLQSKMAVGAGGAKTRDDALELGEARPDYIFFGKFGFDNKPEPHSRNLSLGHWWADMIAIPCIVMGGSVIDSAREVAESGVEFVALSSAVFSAIEPAGAVAQVNALLDAHAPQFDGAT